MCPIYGFQYSVELFLIFIIILHPYLVILKILFGQYIYFVYLQCPRKRSKIYFGAHSLKALTTSHRQNKHTQRMRKIITFKHFVHLWHSSIVWLWTHTEWSPLYCGFVAFGRGWKVKCVKKNIILFKSAYLIKPTLLIYTTNLAILIIQPTHQLTKIIFCFWKLIKIFFRLDLIKNQRNIYDW